MSKQIVIDRCICYDRRFRELKDAADADHLQIDELTSRFGYGSCCGMCRPYIERMLETGETVFHEIMLPRERSEKAERRSEKA